LHKSYASQLISVSIYGIVCNVNISRLQKFNEKPKSFSLKKIKQILRIDQGYGLRRLTIVFWKRVQKVRTGRTLDEAIVSASMYMVERGLCVMSDGAVGIKIACWRKMDILDAKCDAACKTNSVV